MALVSFRSQTHRQYGVGNDQRLLMYRFSKSRSKSSGTPSTENYAQPRTSLEKVQEIRAKARDNYTSQGSRDSRGRRADFRDSVVVVTSTTEDLGTGDDVRCSRNSNREVKLDLTKAAGPNRGQEMDVSRSETTSFARLDMVSNKHYHDTFAL